VEIIPVIDVMGGKVVHAQGGVRSEYPLLESVITKSNEPLAVIKDLLTYYPFSTVYMADLDAIMSGKRSDELYSTVSEAFPTLNVYLDAGVTDKTSWQSLSVWPNIIPIIASETLSEYFWLRDPDVLKKSILSLDFKQGEFLGEQGLLSSPHHWPQKIIAMNLDCIGSQSGPDLELLLDLKTKSTREIIAAGGVRTEQDLMLLKQQGIKRVLIASALHDGRINKQSLEKI